jgi:hypothetical protein
MTTIVLPRLAGTRRLAGEICDAALHELEDTAVTVDASANLTSTQGFIDELVQRIVEHGNDVTLTVAGANNDFRAGVEQVMRQRNLPGIQFQDEHRLCPTHVAHIDHSTRPIPV